MAYKPLAHIPTHLISGILGVGKSSALLALIQQQPPEEVWAVLINEFAPAGMDALLLQDQVPQDAKVTFAEVAGGCACCLANLPFKVALNRLLRQTRPDRVLIEATGLSHTRELKHLLTGPEYAQVLDLQSVMTLVDARQLTQYAQHPLWIGQVQAADCLVANKTDVYQAEDYQNLQAWQMRAGLADKPCYLVSQGRVHLQWLMQPAVQEANKAPTPLFSPIISASSSSAYQAASITSTVRLTLSREQLAASWQTWYQQQQKTWGTHIRVKARLSNMQACYHLQAVGAEYQLDVLPLEKSSPLSSMQRIEVIAVAAKEDIQNALTLWAQELGILDEA
ncbi:GTPase, G3E family [Allopseudospirillum japonicum]|uniref:GTPase, G3E family n=1 Tax=Allopseudospirillum japonicum TaxID=64971 RepID=A0A1H6Q0S8_9GAMM|nr:GTP-binding protein [Allopseudospirillum japonicum]SEI37448.1 GTPase, G3E family [Allopseudospirillum japonicum]